MADKNIDIPFGYPGNPGFMQDSPFVPEQGWEMPPEPFMQPPEGLPYYVEDQGIPTWFGGFDPNMAMPNVPMPNMAFPDIPYPDMPFPGAPVQAANGYQLPAPMLGVQQLQGGQPPYGTQMMAMPYHDQSAPINGMPPQLQPPMSQMPPMQQPMTVQGPAYAQATISQASASMQAGAGANASRPDAKSASQKPLESGPQTTANHQGPQVAQVQGPEVARAAGQQPALPSRRDANAQQNASSLRGTPAPDYDATTLPLVQAKFDPNVGRMRNEEVEEKGKRKGFVVAIVLLSIAVVALAGALLYVLDPFGIFAKSEIEPPSEVQVESSFNDAYIPPPDLIGYSYVNDKGLEMVSLSDFAAGEVNYDTTNNASDAYSQCTALATYMNDSITVEQALSLRLIFDRSDRTWGSGSASTISLNVIPTAPADVDAIVGNIHNILSSYNASLATMYEDASVEASPESKLTTDGGILTLTARKTASDGAQLTCVIKCVVAWSQESGWVVKVESVDGDLPPDMLQAVGDNDADAVTPVETTTESISNTVDGNASTEDGEGAAEGSQLAGDASSLVQYRLTCSNGAKVKVPGTIEMQSDKVVLKTFGLMEVVMGGRTYTVDRFQILGGQAFQPGQGVEVCGTIGTGGTLSGAPLTITIA